MKTFVIFSLLILFGVSSNAQVYVNGVDLNKESEIITIYAFKKPFSTKECYFCDYGHDGFRLANYDSKKQCIKDKNGKKFERGEYMKLYSYLKSQGWKKSDEFEESLGDNKGRAIIFERTQTEQEE